MNSSQAHTHQLKKKKASQVQVKYFPRHGSSEDT